MKQTKIGDKLESIKNRFSKTAKEELDDEIAFNDKIASIFLIVNGLFGLYLVVHQTVSTGFFTPIFLGGMLDGNDGMYIRKIL